MAPSTRPALVLGSASLCATLAVLLAGAEQPGCSFFNWTLPAILALQLCFALAAGFATGYRHPHNRESARAGLGTNLMASLSGLILYGIAGTGLLPPICGEDMNGLGVFVLTLMLLFFIAPVAVVGGGAAGWLGGLLARTTPGRIVLACTLIAGLAVSLLLILYQPPGSGVRGIVKAPLCPSDQWPTSGCVMKPSNARITVLLPEGEQVVAAVSSDDLGRYQISLAPGKYEIWAVGRYGVYTDLQEIRISQGNYLTLELDATK